MFFYANDLKNLECDSASKLLILYKLIVILAAAVDFVWTDLWSKLMDFRF